MRPADACVSAGVGPHGHLRCQLAQGVKFDPSNADATTQSSRRFETRCECNVCQLYRFRDATIKFQSCAFHVYLGLRFLTH